MNVLNVLGYSVIPFLVIIVFLVLVHELGHFVTAKLAGVKVLEFGLFYPPKLWGFRLGKKPPCKDGESDCPDERTEYTINALPLGGFVRLLGEEDPSDPRSLAAKPRGIRILVLAAGAIMNMLLPILLFTGTYMIPQQVPYGRVIVAEVSVGSPAAAAGIQSGDQLLKINGVTINNTGDAVYETKLEQGQTMTWEVKRGHDVLTKHVYARWRLPYEVDPLTGKRSQEGPTGISVSSPDPFTRTQSYPIWEAAPKAVQSTFDSLVLARNEVISWVESRSAPQVAGPVGIAQVTGQVVKQSGWASLLQLAALLSINLAIINILPLPMLDGGRILFVIIEILRGGKRVAPEKEALVHFVGFVAIIGLVVVFTYFDISRIVHGGSVF